MEKMDEQASLQRPFAHAFGESSLGELPTCLTLARSSVVCSR
jgi:hypothetical protein